MPPAAPSGISPMSACAPASAASASNSASTHPRADVTSATGPTPTRNENGSELEEDGLIVALQVDIEAPRPVAVGLGQQPCGTVAGGSQRGIRGGGRLAGEVDPGDD